MADPTESKDPTHPWRLSLSIDAESADEVLWRLRDVAWDLQQNMTPGRRFFAGTASSGMADLSHSGSSDGEADRG